MAGRKKILYSVANNRDGEIIHAKDAEKGLNYYCPVCNNDLILRKSGRKGKNCKRPHFAHKEFTPNCTPETALHFTFKTQVYKKIKHLLKVDQPFNFSWTCQYCTEIHQGDLLKKIADARLEFKLDECQPDIVLFNYEGSAFAVIEVVVTHKPEKKVLEYYINNDIILIQYNLTSDIVLEDIEKRLTSPDLVSICFNPKCETCGNYLHKSKMMIINALCYRCNSEIKCATIYSPNGGRVRGGGNFIKPDEFRNNEVSFARSKGVLLKKRYSKTSGYSYLANICGNCNAFIGNTYLFLNYISQVDYSDISSDSYDIGYHCQNCLEQIR